MGDGVERKGFLWYMPIPKQHTLNFQKAVLGAMTPCRGGAASPYLIQLFVVLRSVIMNDVETRIKSMSFGLCELNEKYERDEYLEIDQDLFFDIIGAIEDRLDGLGG